jgi:RimJ/RimL family protein N-acetyltransferase
MCSPNAMDIPGLELELPTGRMRILRPSDVHDGYVCGLNDPAVNRFLTAVKETEQTHESVRAFVQAQYQATDAMLFGIWEEGRDLHCGTVRLHKVDEACRTAEIGICVFDRSAWGKKVGTCAIAAVTRWAQSQLGVDLIKAGVYESNRSSRRAFEAAGYHWQRDVAGEYVLDNAPVVVSIYTSALAAASTVEGS